MIEGRLSLPERDACVSRKRRHQAHQAIASRWKKRSPLAEISNDCLDTLLPPVLQGSRIMDIGNISVTIAEVSTHSGICAGRCVVEGEVMHSGLAVVVMIKCTKCAQIFRLQSLKQVSTSEGKLWLVNIAAVLRQMWWSNCTKLLPSTD